jgi:hypothetical protein
MIDESRTQNTTEVIEQLEEEQIDLKVVTLGCGSGQTVSGAKTATRSTIGLYQPAMSGLQAQGTTNHSPRQDVFPAIHVSSSSVSFITSLNPIY